ncbi:MAG: PIN domain-containing protein [Betaproteobacteria bacterium]|nr:PIN domain-containing protein [Betaproteobacteria bacterium]MBK8738242.1 PIN domain-containing protein [Betaproteobacteria bacterium]MBK9607981.1 PIN domain-containing protein [Betaproteobacteria bacterium]
MKSFFDTNVLVYLFDADSPVKRRKARALFQKHAGDGDILLSTQVLQEFYAAVTRKLARPLGAAAAEEAVTNFAELPLVQVDSRMILAAIRRSRNNQLSLWDALIVQAAIEGHASTLYSEDMQHGLLLDGLRVINPFS